MNAFFSNFTNLTKRFSAESSGNVAIIFGIGLIPIMAVIGVAIDYNRAASARSAMQSAADAAALMISKEARGLSATDLKKKAEAYFKAQFNRTDVGGLDVRAVYSTDSGGQSVVISASATVSNSFMSMAQLGSDKTTPISTQSTVRWGARYRVALALDNTGSMDSASKMDELKKASKKMIEDFAAMAKSPEDILISIVPFAKDVNVGSSNKNQAWVSFDYYGSCINTSNNKVDTSRKSRTACLNVANRKWDTTDAKNNWEGCVTDRDYSHISDYDTKNTLPDTAISGTLYDAEDYNDCPVAMIGMTSVYSKKQILLDKIESMQPKGNTNQQIGLQLAWMTHTVGKGPFPAPSKDDTMEYVDVIILLTDGDNTQNRWSSNGNTIDARQATLCNNIKSDPAKARPIDIYSVQVATGKDAIQPVLKNCATKPNDPAYFSYITNATQLSTKFRDIFESIARLRVTS